MSLNPNVMVCNNNKKNMKKSTYVFKYKRKKEKDIDKFYLLISKIIFRLLKKTSVQSFSYKTGYDGDDFVNKRKTLVITLYHD